MNETGKIEQASCVELWNECLQTIRNNVSEQTFKTWFTPIVPTKYENKTLYLGVPSPFYYEFLEDKFIDLLRGTIYRHFGEGTQLIYKVAVVQNSPETVDLEATKRTILPQEKTKGTVVERGLPAAPATEFDSRLNTEYNFSTFIEGVSNKLARCVGEAVSKEPGKTVFNPFFIYGASGVGKTHLANAIGLKVKELFPQLRVLYVSAHLFQVQYTDSVRNNTTNDFINFYQTIDVLIIDDIQEFAGVTKTQNTFFHIFNQLHQNGKQLVMTSDRSPVLLQGLEERLITRFKWGMVAELEKPSLDLRKDILRSRIHRDGLKFPPEVIDYIAENVRDSIRNLEGIVISIMAHATVYGKDVDMELAQSIVRKSTVVEDKPMSIDFIVETVCRHYGIDAQSIQTKSRKREVVQARQVAMFLAKNNTEHSSAKIGMLIGNRDHATVLHACKTIKEQEKIDKRLNADLLEIQSKLERG